jgi:hypothetical protein
MWNGEISIKYPDCIEILLDDTNLRFNSIYTGKIEKVNQNKIALEVYLSPDSMYDWEIICKQPYSLEQSVLKQVIFHIFATIFQKEIICIINIIIAFFCLLESKNENNYN